MGWSVAGVGVLCVGCYWVGWNAGLGSCLFGLVACLLCLVGGEGGVEIIWGFICSLGYVTCMLSVMLCDMEFRDVNCRVAVFGAV